MSTIHAWGSYVPYCRLDRAAIKPVAGRGGGEGTRSVASFDEDTTTLGVEAARRAVTAWGSDVRAILFSTPAPAYLEKTNATAVHAALRLPREAGAYDFNGSVRSGLAAMRAGFGERSPVVVVTSDIRGGLPGGADESGGGDGAAALVVSGGNGGVAELLAWSAVSEEFLDRWRIPGAAAPRMWEERFGEIRYIDCGHDAWLSCLETSGLVVEEIDHLVVVGTHDRAVAALTKKLGVARERVVPSLTGSIGNLGAAAAGIGLASALEIASPGQVIALVVLADGADVAFFRTTAALAEFKTGHTVARQAASGGLISYGKYLAWRGTLPVDPPRRPEPARPSASAASRSVDWKFGLVGKDGHTVVGRRGRIVAFTIDRLVYSESPPVVFAIVDFAEHGRLPVELTDCDPDAIEIGGRVEMTFRKLFTADGIHNYFWKARPVSVGSD